MLPEVVLYNQAFLQDKNIKIMKTLILLTAGAFSLQCSHPLATENYSQELMSGFWYEQARYQTVGGGLFQLGSVCSGFDFKPLGSSARVSYTSRKQDPIEGRWSNITGRLDPNDEMVEGNFYQSFPWNDPPGISWNVIYLDEDWAIEYDCDEHENGSIDYCVHFVSRVPEPDMDELARLKEWIDASELNSMDRPFVEESQTDCW